MRRQALITFIGLAVCLPVISHAACSTLASGVIPYLEHNSAGLVTVRTTPTTTAGFAPVEGALAYDTTNDVLKGCDGTNWNTLTGSDGSTGVADRISSSGNQAMVLAMPGGTVSFTTGSVAGTSYLDSTGRWIGPGISITTTNGISSTNGYFTGNVGIGTADVDSRLTVKATGDGDAAFQIKRYDNDGAYQVGLGQRFIVGNGGMLDLFGVNGALAGNLTSTHLVATFGPTGAAIGYANPGTARLAVNGNVGIGTVTPTATLQVSGSFTVSTSAQTTTPSLYVGTDGNVGIGTNAPSAVLTVALPSGARSIVSGTSMYPQMAGGLGWRNPGTGPMHFGDTTVGNYILFQGNSGAVLTGTWAFPAYGVFPSPYLAATNLAGGDVRWAISKSGNGPNQTIYATTSHYAVTDGAPSLDIIANGIRFGLRDQSSAWNEAVDSYPLVISASGNVGVGTTDPQSTLHIPDGKYAQFEDFNAGAPASGDCDADTERGRQSIDTSNFRLYICMGAARGWDYTSLTD